jgi:hypothetical protein
MSGPQSLTVETTSDSKNKEVAKNTLAFKHLFKKKMILRFQWFFFAILFFSIFSLEGFTDEVNRGAHAQSCNNSKTPLHIEIKIKLIWSHPDTFKGRKVLISGTYLGWRGQIEHPLITRSDWAVEDDTGAIYVTGLPAKGLDPIRNIGYPLEVFGTVHVNPKGVPYIVAEKVVLKKEE